MKCPGSNLPGTSPWEPNGSSHSSDAWSQSPRPGLRLGSLGRVQRASGVVGKLSVSRAPEMAMSLIRGFIDRLLLVCAIVAGGLVPGFIAQYRQRLGGRLDQAQIDLAPWQKIADQYF